MSEIQRKKFKGEGRIKREEITQHTGIEASIKWLKLYPDKTRTRFLVFLTCLVFLHIILKIIQL